MSVWSGQVKLPVRRMRENILPRSTNIETVTEILEIRLCDLIDLLLNDQLPPQILRKVWCSTS